MIAQPVMLSGIETVLMTSSNVKKLEVAEMKMCKWACGHIRNDNIRERLKANKLLKVENITERYVQESKIEVIWTCQEATPTIRLKKDSGDDTNWEKKARDMNILRTDLPRTIMF